MPVPFAQPCLRAGINLIEFDRKGLRRVFVGLAMTALVVSATTAAEAQSKSKKTDATQKISATLKSVERKGKSAKLLVTKDDGDTMELMILPKTNFQVVAPGDASSFATNQVVSTDAVLVGENLIANEFVIHLGHAPATKVVQDPQERTVYHVCGSVQAADADGLAVNFGGAGGVKRVLFQTGVELKVRMQSTDPSHAVEGAGVDVEGMSRSGKFLPSAITVKLTEPIKHDEPAAPAGKAKSSKTAGKTKGKSTSDDGEMAGDKPKGEPLGETFDPFKGVEKPDLKTKGKKKPAGKGTEKEMEGAKGEAMEKTT